MRRLISYFSVLLILGCNSGLHKEIKEVFPNGKPRIIAYYDLSGGDSLLVKEEICYSNGDIGISGEYGENGMPDGKWIFYYEDHRKTCEADFMNGKRSGEWKIQDFNGKPLTSEQYTIEEYEDGLPKTIRFFRQENGETIKTGEIHFYENHIRKSEGPVKDNKKNGLWKAWRPDGTKWSEGEFAYDVNNGKTIVWYSNGQIYYEGEYRLGDRIGIWRFWKEDGELMKEIDYEK